MRKEGIDARGTTFLKWMSTSQIQQSFINIISNARFALNEKYPKA
jgi:hypothetical protein